MAYINGLILIDAPASALNNGQSDDTTSRVKKIRSGMNEYAYVSSQAYRHWLRTTLKDDFSEVWKSSPVETAGAGKKQQAYTAGDPITYYDDDLFGYMKATSEETVTRVSPFRVGTLVSVGPVSIVEDFGVMARVEKKEGDKEGVVLFGHEFYRAVLAGMFSLDLSSAGTFTNQMRSGYQNLGKQSIEKAQNLGLEEITKLKMYRLNITERIQRVQTLLYGMGRIEGGAKQALHYTPVSPVFVLATITRGGNNLFGHVIKHNRATGEAELNEAALKQVLETFKDDILSRIYVGRVEGFMDSAQTVFDKLGWENIPHPRQALDALAQDLAEEPSWME